MRKYLQNPFHCRTHPKTLPPSFSGFCQGKKPQLFHKERTMVLLRAELPSAQFKGLYVTEYPFSTLTFNTKCIILSRGLGALRSLLKPPLVEYLRKKKRKDIGIIIEHVGFNRIAGRKTKKINLNCFRADTKILGFVWLAHTLASQYK